MTLKKLYKNELTQIVEKYFSREENKVNFFGNGEEVQEVMRFFSGFVQYDHPDAYSIIGNEALLLEHFEFDSSNRTKAKGSQQRRSEAEDIRVFSQELPTETGTVHHSLIDADYTIQNYKNNLSDVFGEHYYRISDYKRALAAEGILQSNISVRTLFFIEDTTLLGNVFETDSWEKPVLPVILPMCDFFLDLFEKSPDLDYALCGSWVPNDYQLWFIGRSMIEDYRKNQIITSEIHICNFSPHSVGMKMVIPDIPEPGK